MSDSESKPKTAQLPKFKEKVMYVAKNSSNTKIESSYVISSSFKGIVRLSPNNHTSVNQRIITQLSPQDQNSLGTTYTDAIVFEDKALQSIKTDADITRRLIIGSDSDGYLVNFRLGIDDVEFDNLGVIGIAKTKEMTILSTKSSYKDSILSLNGTAMPAFAQSIETSSEIDKDLLDIIDDESYSSQSSLLNDRSLLDVNHVEVKGRGDKSYLLYSETLDKKRVFKYKQTQKFIKQLILQALLELQTVPVGSIHWLPVSVEQYKALLLKGHTPNKFYYQNGQNEIEVDPIIRDYLLCDGREYDNTDFPELAKVLWGEKIVIWKKADGIEGDTSHKINGNTFESSGYYPVQHINDYSENKKFRVPDLRHKFITSCHFNSSISLTKDPDISVYSGKNWNTTGTYTIDNTPINLSPNVNQDNHVHFIAYGTNGMINRSSNQRFTNYNTMEKVATANGLWKISGGETSEIENLNGDFEIEYKAIKLSLSKDDCKPRVMYLQNHPIYRNTQFGSGTKSKNGANGFSYGQFPPQRSCEWKNLRTNWSQPAIMYLSMPGGTQATTRRTLQNNHKNDNMMGKSSVQIPSLAKVSSNGVYGADENNILNNEKYVEFKENIYGHESSPKFYAMLPLIKI